MLENGYRSARNAKSGVDVGPLSKAVHVTREMARRYTEGTAIPDIAKMQTIADWLGVRLPWLRDGDGPARTEGMVAEPAAGYHGLTEEGREIALVWQSLPLDQRETMRNLLYLLRLGVRRFPWLSRGRPKSETYAEWERRQEQNFYALSQLEQDRVKQK
jgi:transcriptional regulator with XRE-family HTH domain